MDRLQLAQRRYRQIIPDQITTLTEISLRKVVVWLTDDVCPLVDDYAKRPSFREHATWPLQVLAPRADTAERKLIDAVDRGFVTEAKLLLSLARRRPVGTALAASNPPRERVVEEVVLVGGGKVEQVSAKVAPVDELAIETDQVAGIANRYWSDLVCPEDYFEPRGDWMNRQPNLRRRQAGEFIVSLNPELHPIGNFVTRCLLRRVDEILNTLRSLGRKCLDAARSAGPNQKRAIEAEQECWTRLNSDIQTLKKALMGNSAGCLRDSCIILMQAYAAFHPAPDLSWLGLRPEVVADGATTLRHRLTCSHDGVEMTDRIAAALGDLGRLYLNDSHEEARIEEAVATGGLVLVEARREVFWEKRRVDAAWNNRSKTWELLLQFASKGRHQTTVSVRDLESTGTSPTQMPTAVNRLKNVVPPSLAKLIENVYREGAYRLRLDRNRIHLF